MERELQIWPVQSNRAKIAAYTSSCTHDHGNAHCAWLCWHSLHSLPFRCLQHSLVYTNTNVGPADVAADTLRVCPMASRLWVCRPVIIIIQGV